MACICRCPKKAIEYGKHSRGLARYTCQKDIEIGFGKRLKLSHVQPRDLHCAEYREIPTCLRRGRLL